MFVRVSLMLVLFAFLLAACTEQQEQEKETLREGLRAAIIGQKHEEALLLYLQLREIDHVTDEQTLAVLWLAYFCFDNIELALDMKAQVHAAPDERETGFPEIEYHHLYARISCQSGSANFCRDHSKAALDLISQKDRFSFYHTLFRPELEQMLLAVDSDDFHAVNRSSFEYEPCSEDYFDR